MGRHRTPQEKQELGEQARAMRAAGRSRREIQAELGIGDDLAGQLLAGAELPDVLRRPRAKDDIREQAVLMRQAGRTYDDIALDLGVSKSSLSLWLRNVPRCVVAGPPPETVTGDAAHDAARRLRTQGALLKEIAAQLGISVKTASIATRGLPWPERARHGGDAAHVRAMAEARWGEYRRQRDAATQQRKLEAAVSVGDVDDRTLLLLGAVAYWCEGAKSKPWRRQGMWVFINSDPLLMRLMVRWLRLVGVPPERWVVRIQIHETGDLKAAEQYWRHVLGLPELQFGKASIKRHVPRTNRKNVGEGYHGCVSIYVRKGAHLLEQVEGWVVGALLGAGGELPERSMLWSLQCDTGAS
jgi:transposase-like protein